MSNTDPLWDELLDANMRAVDNIPLAALPKWLKAMENDSDPRKLPGYIWHSFLFTERKKGRDYLVADRITKEIFRKFAQAKLDSGKENPNLLDQED